MFLFISDTTTQDTKDGTSSANFSTVVGGAVGGAIIGVLVVGVVIIMICVILVFVKRRSKKGLRIHDQGGAAFGNAVYDGGMVGGRGDGSFVE